MLPTLITRFTATFILKRGGSLARSSLIQRPTLTFLQRYTSGNTSNDQPQENRLMQRPLDNVSLDYHPETEVISDTVVPTKKKNDALLRVNEEDLVDVAPQIRPTFNFAAYANKSHTLQELIKLGVNLTKWEKDQEISSYLLRLEFEDMKPHIIYLNDVGVSADDLGRWLSLNPYIFKESIGDLQVRFNYLLSKKFDRLQIARIISRNPKWLLHSTVEIDSKLGFFQHTFKLSNREVRLLATKQPKLITHNLELVKVRNFSILEEMGFTFEEMKSLLLSKPKLWLAHGVSLMRRFDYIHNEMGLAHSHIVEFPNILTHRDFKIKQRHKYLKLIGRDQFDPSKPNYISPDSFVAGDDIAFCTNVAKSPVIEFNNFLKTL
ncbi:transcription termination factor 3, mitochondrial [Palaemon carinicauda]|uniref:transcription termination factor 3, mitochondrial n=1 Tax=Palaemon carinicauda TaxID=392227 RepID=UPI0035B69728